MRWSASIAVLSAAFVIPAWGDSQPAPSAVPDAATVFETTIRPYSGSSEAVQTNLVTPLIQGSQMKTPDGLRQFTVNTLQSTGKPILRVSAFLNAPTGDLSGITVEQDLNASGSINSVSLFPFDGGGRLISSVCANGYVQCDPGTYSNCQYRTWSADATGKIAATAASSVNDLSSCFCFNHFCSQNNNAILNVDTIASDTASGILATILAVRNDFAITSVKSDGTGTVSYYGAHMQGSVNGANSAAMTPQQIAEMPVIPSSDPDSLQGYYNSSPASLDALGSATLQAQQALPNSLFSLVNNTMMNQTGQNFYCSNRRSVSLVTNHYTQSLEQGFNGDRQLCTDHYVFLILSRDSSGNPVIGYRDTSPSFFPGQNCSPEPYSSDLGALGYLAGRLTVTPPSQSTDFKLTKTDAYMKFWGDPGCVPGDGSTTWFDGATVPIISLTGVVCPAPGAQAPFYAFRLTAEYDSQDLQEQTDMGCAQFANDQSCKLQQDIWDNRPVYTSFMPTGFQLAQVCQNIPGPMRNVQVCRDWWEQDKVFVCQHTQSTYDFGGVQQRIQGIQNTVTMPDDRTMNYTDSGTNISYGVFQKQPLPACQQVCKTKTPAPQSLLTPIGPKSSQQTASGVADSSWRYSFKNCVESPPGTFTCPIDTTAGEAVVTDCACSGDMGEAIGALQAVDGAAQDSICSSN